MQIQIKLLGRDPHIIQVTPETSISSIKQQIHLYLRIPIEAQKLVFEGQILKDDKKIKHFTRLQNNSKIHLIVVIKKTYPLYNKLYDIVRLHCNETETQKILSIFMRKMYDSFSSLSLDDLERIAQGALQPNFVENGRFSKAIQEPL
ncbi:ubiquitin-like protein 4A [Planococcus citri]|uniref:ubiquitin-like protein 4A n=1 Tax=Planococcus citri TaxID=170843 RepID=UPI0031F86B5C